jgi:glycerol-3-phosphate dehydrogenase
MVRGGETVTEVDTTGVSEAFQKVIESTPGLEPHQIRVALLDHGVLELTGEVRSWDDVVRVGHLAAGLEGVRGVCNDLRVPGVEQAAPPDEARVAAGRAKGELGKADVVIVGAGVIGCAVARELSRYNLNIIVLERASDICEGTTKGNNGMVHSGYDSKPGTLKALLNVRGNAMYTQWAEELDFPLDRTGSFVLAFDDEDMEYIESYRERGATNGVPGIAILTGDEARAIEPAISHEAVAALWTPSAAYIEPYEVSLALAENAVANGVRFLLNTEVLALEKNDGLWGVISSNGVLRTRYVVNAAGVYADIVARMVGDKSFTIHPRKGMLAIFDKIHQDRIRCFLGTAPKGYTKGGGPMQTPEGNPLWGPSAWDVPDREDVSVEARDFEFVLTKGLRLAAGVELSSMITYFSGVRASTYTEDFVIRPSWNAPGIVHVAGIQSPGLASAPAIAERVVQIFQELEPELSVRPGAVRRREAHRSFRHCTPQQQAELWREDPRFGHVVCRCETVTEAEVVNAIHGVVPAQTMDAVKRRTRAGMGRCQGGFCGPRVLSILARELQIKPTEVTKKGPGSYVLDSLLESRTHMHAKDEHGEKEA